MEAAPAYPHAAGAAPAVLTCEASVVKIGYIWLMVLLPVAGLCLGLVNLVTAPSGAVLLLAAGLVALGYWAWRRAYTFVRLELRPTAIQLQPEQPGQPAQAIALARIANYLRPQESFYQIMELELHGSPSLRFSKRLRAPGSGLVALDDWAEVLAQRLEQARPAAVPGVAAGSPTAAPASGLRPAPTRVFARTTLGKVLAGLAGVWLVLAGLAKLGGDNLPGAVFLAPIFYLGYYLRAKGVLKVETRVVKGSLNVERDDQQYGD